MVTIDIGKKHTAEEYLELEKASLIRHEFYHGNIYEMDGTTLTQSNSKEDYKDFRQSFICFGI